MIKKTDNFFVISNYNTDPSYLLAYCNNYIVYDQSEKEKYDIENSGLKYERTKHSGHNISDYFKFFIDHYDDLPQTMALIKGNIIDRHLTRSFFERVYNNKYYTFLFYDEKVLAEPARYNLSSENEFLETNTSWYVPFHPARYFNDYNKLLRFIYKDPLIPKYCLFSPGACYIVTREQVLKNSKEFYINLSKILSYTLEPKFPSEAHQVERMMHTIYTSNYPVHDHMNNLDAFDKALELHVLNDPKPDGPSILQKINRYIRRLCS